MLLLLLACVASIPTDDEAADSAANDTHADSGGDSGADSGADSGGDSGADSGADSGSDSGADSGGDSGADSGGDSGGDSGATRAEQVCARWNADRADLSEGSWSGNVNSCDAGDMSAAGRANALKLTNLYRFLAQQPEVRDDATRNAGAQECALMEHAHGSLSHYPDESWRCYTSSGASTAGMSNIASAPAVYAVDMYMIDWGNDTTIGHRRWLLSNQLGPVGIGSTNQYSCMYVLYGSGSGTAPWVAWPPPGPFPVEAFFHGGSYSLDDTGWTIQSDSIDLSRATVTVTASGADKPVTVTQLSAYYGSTYAIKLTPRGWQAQAGTTYSVTVANTSTPISYDVEVTDCG